MSSFINPVESASDAFVCLPSASDIASLDDAFAAVGEVYLAAWHECQRLFPFPPDTDLSSFADLHNAMSNNRDILDEIIGRGNRDLARGLGPNIDPVFTFYVRKAISDHEAGIVPNDLSPSSAAGYQPWLHIGFPLPFENVSIETTEDGLDWLRFGTIGPVAFGFTGSVPTRVHTACFKRTDDLSGYEVVFVGEEIDVADGAML
jgi:hypothetical protein